MSNIQSWSMLIVVPFVCMILSKWHPWLVWPAFTILVAVGLADVWRIVRGKRTFSSYIQGQTGRLKDALIFVALIVCAYIPWGWQGVLIAVMYVLVDHFFGFWNK